LAQPIKLFLSSSVWQQGGPHFISARPHYVYEIARRKFETAMRFLEVELHDLPRPEIYAAPVSRTFLDETACHLIFKPTEWIRVLKDARNIAWVTWEFDRLRGNKTSGPSHPFADMRRMLMIPDEIWAPCEFTRQVFRAGGVSHVYRVPVPIEVPRMPTRIRFPHIPPDLDKIPWINLRLGFGRYSDINRTLPGDPHRISNIIGNLYPGRQPLVITSILNPYEPLKNLTALVGGFLEFHSEYPDSLLLLKLVVNDTNDSFDNALLGILRQCISGFELIDSNAIWLTTDYLAEPVLADLCRLSSAYLCSSLAEGQNLALQEAMAWGVVPVTPRHTAMLDYISNDNAIIIRSRRSAIDRSDTAVGPDPDASWHVCTSADVACALRQFAGLSEPARRDLGARAHATMERDFSIPAIARLVYSRLFEHR
jgi:glycosyltransferase involved in cell wall biosynthesis